MTINVDIDLLRLPCSILSLDIQDVMGSHTVNIHGSLMKYRLSKTGQVLGEEKYEIKEKKPKEKNKAATDQESEDDDDEDDSHLPDYEMVKSEINNKEGCRIRGYFFVNKVPGNFHISSHAFSPIISKLFADGYTGFDVSHKITHLSFGEDKDLKVIKQNFADGELNPLDGINKIDDAKKFYEYYIKVSSNLIIQNLFLIFRSSPLLTLT